MHIKSVNFTKYSIHSWHRLSTTTTTKNSTYACPHLSLSPSLPTPGTSDALHHRVRRTIRYGPYPATVMGSIPLSQQ
jgi:hypothetical protein